MFTDRVAALELALDALLAEDLIVASSAELLDGLRDLERFKRRLAVVDHQLIAQVDDRNLAGELCASSTAAMLRQLLRISPGEASARVRAAANLGPRRSLPGQPLGPLFEHVATAVAAGAISAEHARVIVRAVDALPAALPAEFEQVVEVELVGHAHEFDPVILPTGGPASDRRTRSRRHAR